MNKSIKKGVGFGITSGVITTLGLMVGLYSGTHSMIAIIGGIITIAIADAFSDSLGIHISEETVERSSRKIWQSTFATFISKFFTAIIFLIPILLLSLKTAIITNIGIGMILLGIFSYELAKSKKEKPFGIIAEHIIISIGVIIITYFVGKLIGVWFG